MLNEKMHRYIHEQLSRLRMHACVCAAQDSAVGCVARIIRVRRVELSASKIIRTNVKTNKVESAKLLNSISPVTQIEMLVAPIFNDYKAVTSFFKH